MKKSIAVIAALSIAAVVAAPASAYTFFGKKTDTDKAKKKAVVAKQEVQTAAPPAPLKERAALPFQPFQETASPAPRQATAPASPAGGDPEALKKFKAIQNQEDWVAKLKKQLDGEISQLNEMRASLAQSFGLDVKKLQEGSYQYDAKTGKFVEK